MKKLLLTLAILITMGIVIFSCSKGGDIDPYIPPTPPIVELAPTMELSVSSSSILYSADVVVTWKTTNAKSVSINGETMTSTNGSKTYSSLITTTKYTALATNVVKTATDEKTVVVADEISPSIELTVTPASVVYGVNSIAVNWVISNFKTATLNGESIGGTGSKVFSNLTETKEFQIIAKNFVKTTTETKSVTVGDWTTSEFGLLTHGTFRVIRFTVWVGDLLYVEHAYTDEDKLRLWYFYQNYTYDIFNADGTRWASGPLSTWGFSPDNKYFIWGVNSFLIEKLDENEFVISRPVKLGYNGTELDAVERYNFVR